MLRNPTTAERSAVHSPAEQPTSWGSSLTRMLSIGAADDGLDTGEAVDRKQLAGWRLSMVDSRTPAAMLNDLLRCCGWAAAFDLCSKYSLSAEAVHQARWVAEPVSLRSLQTDLAQVSDRRWAVEQLVQRTAHDEATQRALLKMALDEIASHLSATSPPATDAAAFEASAAQGSPAVEAEREERLWWLCRRLQALQRLDRLDTLLAVLDGCAMPSKSRRHDHCLTQSISP